MKNFLSILQLNGGFGKRENNRIPTPPIQIPQWTGRFRWRAATLPSAGFEEPIGRVGLRGKIFAPPILSLDKL